MNIEENDEALVVELYAQDIIILAVQVHLPKINHLITSSNKS